MGLISNGTTLLDAGALDSGVATGAMVLLSTQTASSSSTISFTSGIDSTYKEYIFKFIDIHAQTDGAKFQFQGDTGSNTNYNQTITSTNFRAYHNEADSQTGLGYITSADQAQGTAFQNLSEDSQGADTDQSLNGTLHIFEPSSSTFVKHFMAHTVTSKNAGGQVYCIDGYVAGYFNLTTALTRFQFKMDSGNIDSGTIKLYGIS